MSQILWQSVTQPAPGKLEYIEKYTAGQTLLDVGCAQGWYAQKAQALGFDVLATDLTNFMVVKNIPFQQIQPGQIDPGQGKKFDTVLMFDVLEHIQDETKALRELSRICQRRLILSVPNADDQNLPDYNLTLVNRKDTTHQRYYTMADLQHKLEQHGFKIVRMEFQGAALPGMVGAYFQPKVLGKFIAWMLNKLLFARILKSPYWGDIYLVADKIQPTKSSNQNKSSS